MSPVVGQMRGCQYTGARNATIHTKVRLHLDNHSGTPRTLTRDRLTKEFGSKVCSEILDVLGDELHRTTNVRTS